MSDHTYEFDVVMSCGGCSGAISRVLSKLEGVKSHEENLETQKVTVVTDSTLDYQTVLTKIHKTGKTIKAGKADGAEQSIEVAV